MLADRLVIWGSSAEPIQFGSGVAIAQAPGEFIASFHTSGIPSFARASPNLHVAHMAPGGQIAATGWTYVNTSERGVYLDRFDAFTGAPLSRHLAYSNRCGSAGYPRTSANALAINAKGNLLWEFNLDARGLAVVGGDAGPYGAGGFLLEIAP